MRCFAILSIIGATTVRRHSIEVSADAEPTGDQRPIHQQTRNDFNWGGAMHLVLGGKGTTGPIDADNNIILLRRGHQGRVVRLLQSRLNDHNYPVAEDSKFGPRVQKAVKEFQVDRGLSVDGFVGPLTWDKLWSLPAFPAVEEVKSDTSVEALRAALKNENRDVRKAAVEELVNRDEEAAPAMSDLLEVAMHDDDGWVTRAAVKAVGQLGEHVPAEVYAELVGHLKDPAVAAGASGVLGALADFVPLESVRELASLLTGDAKTAQRAVMVLYRMGENAAPAMQALRKALRTSEHASVRYSAVASLGHVGDHSALALGDICDALQDEHSLVRDAAADALGDLEERAAPCLDGLLAALKDPAWGVRTSAASALGDLKSKAAPALPALRAAQESDAFGVYDSGPDGVDTKGFFKNSAKRTLHYAISKIERATAQ